MIDVLYRLIRRLMVVCVLFMCLLFSQRAVASNRAVDIKIIEEPGQTLFLIELEERPRFGLESLDESHVLLTFFDTSSAPDLPVKVSEQSGIEIQKDEGADDMGFKIGLSRPIHRLDSSWLEDRNIFCIKILPGEDDKDPAASVQTVPILKGVRFGFKEKATRMVMSLDKRPSWEMSYEESTSISMRLQADSKDLKEKKYGPMRLLKEVNVLRQDLDEMDIALKLESPMNHVRIFWMEVGNRLVMDLFNEPMDIDEEIAIIHAQKGEQEAVAPISDDNSDEGAEEEQPIINVVKMKMPEKDDAAQIKTEERRAPAVNNKDLKIEPKLDNFFPFSPESDVSLNDLSPEEAFLFGRIQEAREINDNNKGLILASHFLKEFPQSVLAENISFWRGDFNYSLFRAGDEMAATDVVLSYQYAIDRFGWTNFTPMAYIKMAQVSSMTEDDYSAIGFLGLVIGRGENGAYMPMAYLMRGKIYLQMGQAEKAIEDFKVLLQKYPDSPLRTEARFWVANYFHMIGQYEEAEKRLLEIAETNPDLFLEYPEYLFITARNYLYMNKFDLARDYLFQALNLGSQPESIDMLLSRIGDTYHNQNREKEAEKYYRMVIDYYPESEGASIAKLRLADYFSDIAILENLSNENNNGPIGDLAMLEKAYQLFEREQYLAVQDNLKGLIEKPIETETRKEAKQLFYRASEKEIVRLHEDGKPEELTALYRSKKELLKENIDPEVLLLAAQAYNDLGMYDESVSTFSQIRPYDLKRKSKGLYFYGLARGYMGNNDKKSARSLLEKSENQELEPLDRKRLDMLLADIYLEEGEMEEANLLYRAVVNGKETLPNGEIARAYLSMGIISNRQKDYRESKRVLNRCIALARKVEKPDDLLQSAHMEMGKVLWNEGNSREAAKYFELGFELGYGPERREYWDNRFRLALSYIDTGEGPKAEPILNEISEEGDQVLQQRAQIRLGSIGLSSQLKRLSIGEIGEE